MKLTKQFLACVAASAMIVPAAASAQQTPQQQITQPAEKQTPELTSAQKKEIRTLAQRNLDELEKSGYAWLCWEFEAVNKKIIEDPAIVQHEKFALAMRYARAVCETHIKALNEPVEQTDRIPGTQLTADTRPNVQLSYKNF